MAWETLSKKAMISGLFLSWYAIVLLPIVFHSSSLGISEMFKFSELLGVKEWQSIWICVISIGIIDSIYAIFGDLKAVAVSETIHAVGLLLGGLLIPYFGLISIGDDSSFWGGLSELTNEYPEKLNAIVSSDSSIPFTTIFTGIFLPTLDCLQRFYPHIMLSFFAAVILLLYFKYI